MYGAYLKGLTAQGQMRYEGFRRAVAYFEEAIAIQPDFAEAHAAMAFAQLQFLFGGPLSPHEAMPKAEAAARRALQLDDTLARAHVALGQILLLYHWRKEEGEGTGPGGQLQGADGDEFTSGDHDVLTRRGRFPEAIAAAERARKLDPLSVGHKFPRHRIPQPLVSTIGRSTSCGERWRSSPGARACTFSSA